ncbi:MAG: multiheme c-type cytochrome [Calditrichaceae bacterium]
MEPYQKVFVDYDFLETIHGEIPCTDCHNGDPDEMDLKNAHLGIIRDPSYENVLETCGGCHEDISTDAENSLHYSLQPYREKIYRRAGFSLDKSNGALDLAMKNHCSSCHSSCGQCHVSRPVSVDGGLVDNHFFFKKPPMETNCTSCHGSRLEKEYTGKNPNVAADVHFQKKAMQCTGCHTALEMHETTKAGIDMKNVENSPQCLSCHETLTESGEYIEIHKTHVPNVACQVCHSMPYKNCYGCHVGKDAKGLPYFQLDKSEMNFKIGKNLHPTDKNPATFVIVRHVPVNRNIFDFYGKNLLPDFNSLPTWKFSSPHNIQRKTPQNEKCNNCHGNSELFLTEKDIMRDEIKANKDIYLNKDQLPKAIN